MRMMVLAVPDCPNAMLPEERLAQVLDGRRDVSVSRQVIENEQEAVRQGMDGSPTILVDGTHPFAEPGQSATLPPVPGQRRPGQRRAVGKPAPAGDRRAGRLCCRCKQPGLAGCARPKLP